MLTLLALIATCEFCPTMVTIPAGTATVGSADTDTFKSRDEGPRRTFIIAKPFRVSKHEVTRGQYEAFVRETHRTPGGTCLTDRTKRGTWVYDEKTTHRDPGFTQADDHPVACVSWEDTAAYVAWLNSKTGGRYRLLTEVEWEYVARAGAPTLYPWGDAPGDGCPFANGFDQKILPAYSGVDTSGHKVFDPLPCNDGWLNTAPVGSLAANRFGVHDMIGNVSEWVKDCNTATHDDLDQHGVPPPSPVPCAKRVAKGGSWGTLAHNLRTGDRFPYPPGHRDDSIGIRLAQDIP
jgi:formylglycine-generating enzyme required for sulfatase activity